MGQYALQHAAIFRKGQTENRFIFEKGQLKMLILAKYFRYFYPSNAYFAYSRTRDNLGLPNSAPRYKRGIGYIKKPMFLFSLFYIFGINR